MEKHTILHIYQPDFEAKCTFQSFHKLKLLYTELYINKTTNFNQHLNLHDRSLKTKLTWPADLF